MLIAFDCCRHLGRMLPAFLHRGEHRVCTAAGSVHSATVASTSYVAKTLEEFTAEESENESDASSRFSDGNESEGDGADASVNGTRLWTDKRVAKLRRDNDRIQREAERVLVMSQNCTTRATWRPIPPPSFDEGVMLPLKIVRLTSPADLRCYLSRQDDVISKLTTLFNLFQSVSASSGLCKLRPSQLKPTLHCAVLTTTAHFPTAYFRAILTGQPKRISKPDVWAALLVDFGLTAIVHADEIFALDACLTNVAALTVSCSMADIKPPDGRKSWGTETQIMRFLDDASATDRLKAVVVSKNGSTMIRIYLDGVCLNDSFVQKGLCVYDLPPEVGTLRRFQSRLDFVNRPLETTEMFCTANGRVGAAQNLLWSIRCKSSTKRRPSRFAYDPTEKALLSMLVSSVPSKWNVDGVLQSLMFYCVDYIWLCFRERREIVGGAMQQSSSHVHCGLCSPSSVWQIRDDRTQNFEKESDLIELLRHICLTPSHLLRLQERQGYRERNPCGKMWFEDNSLSIHVESNTKYVSVESPKIVSPADYVVEFAQTGARNQFSLSVTLRNTKYDACLARLEAVEFLSSEFQFTLKTGKKLIASSDLTMCERCECGLKFLEETSFTLEFKWDSSRSKPAESSHDNSSFVLMVFLVGKEKHCQRASPKSIILKL